MGNYCYGQQNNRNYIDKDIRVQHTIGTNFSISKSQKKIGVDTDLSAKITSVREEKYANSIPRVLELVEKETQTSTTYQVDPQQPLGNL